MRRGGRTGGARAAGDEGLLQQPARDRGGAARRLAVHRRHGPPRRDGYYTIVDRKRDIIKTSGFLVFPAEVEEVLRGYPDVAEAAVIGVPDTERGEMVKALVVPRSGAKLDVGGPGGPLQAAPGQAQAAAADRGGAGAAARTSWARCCGASCASRARNKHSRRRRTRYDAGKEVHMIELTEQQMQALETANGDAPRVVIRRRRRSS